jgi:hypothetical protein
VNFISVNAGACKQPKVSAKLINSIANRVKEKQAKRIKEKTTCKSSEAALSLPNAGQTFGLATRPSTPLREVIQNKFGQEGEAESFKRYKAYHAQQVSQGKMRITVKPTRSSQGHALSSKALENEGGVKKELFKLSRFKRIPSRLNLHNATPEVRTSNETISV